MNKKIYIIPEVSVIEVREEEFLMRTSRDAQVGETPSPNEHKDHYGDPTGHIDNMDGGESL